MLTEKYTYTYYVLYYSPVTVVPGHGSKYPEGKWRDPGLRATWLHISASNHRRCMLLVNATMSLRLPRAVRTWMPASSEADFGRVAEDGSHLVAAI